MVILLIVCCVISTTLNPFVMIYNFRKSNSIPKTLFFTLASCDFMICLIIPINSLINVHQSGPAKCYVADGGAYVCGTNFAPSTGIRLLSIVILTLALAPSCFTSILAISRYITIRFPFKIIKQRYSILFVSLYLVYALTINSVVVLDEYAVYRDTISIVINPYYFSRTWDAPGYDVWVLLLCIWPLLFSQLLSIVASVLTIKHLVHNAKNAEEGHTQINSTKVSLKILVTNLSGLILTAAAAISADIQVNNAKDGKTEESDQILDFTTMVVVPVFLSSINPIIFILFTPNAMKIFQKSTRVSPMLQPMDASFNPICSLKRIFVVTHGYNSYSTPLSTK